MQWSGHWISVLIYSFGWPLLHFRKTWISILHVYTIINRFYEVSFNWSLQYLWQASNFQTYFKSLIFLSKLQNDTCTFIRSTYLVLSTYMLWSCDQNKIYMNNATYRWQNICCRVWFCCEVNVYPIFDWLY